MYPEEFEPRISVYEQSKIIYASEGVATGVACKMLKHNNVASDEPKHDILKSEGCTRTH
jgi:hypothetical protein